MLAIPISALTGGWLSDVVGVAPVYAAGGLWLLACGVWAATNPSLLTARVDDASY